MMCNYNKGEMAQVIDARIIHLPQLGSPQETGFLCPTEYQSRPYQVPTDCLQ